MIFEWIFIGVLLALTLFFAWRSQTWKLRKNLTEEQLKFTQQGYDRLKDSFASLSQEALEKNSKSFLDLAASSFATLEAKAKGELAKKEQSIHDLVKPVKETLSKLDEGLHKLEKERRGDHTALKSHMESLATAKQELSKETANLVKALRSPVARGRWGEIQLRRVVEMAGMLNQCDFYEQETSDSGTVRPDLIIKLPGGRQVVIDSKVPLESYLDAIQTDNEAIREEKFKNHARLIRTHISALSKKSYHQHFNPTPEFVVLFLPSETFFSAALQYDPTLIEAGADQGVIIATPTTLIALLRAVAYGWKQESLSRHAEEVSQLGHELYKRVVDMASHFSKMGRSLGAAVEAYNKGVGSLESRVLVSARKFQDLGAAATKLEIEAVEVIEKVPRDIHELS